ncbi:MAG TPA: tyrosine-type recombinase/integrase [Rubrobacteraceae bacterium]|nr:tyrosine-type recombinase/integrase [Rubrobacteraceae bacterium]
MSTALEGPATGLLPAPPSEAVGPPNAATVRPAPMPNFSGAETDERLVELWLARKAPSTRRKYAEDLAKFRDFTEGKPLSAVTLSDLHDFASFISVLMAPSSQGRVLATTKSLLSFANKVGYLPFNVGAAVELPKVKDTLSERILTEAEAHRIMNAPKSARDRALISLLYAGALRREEAVHLKWRDLKDRDDLGAGVGQATIFGKGSRTGVTLLPASVYSQVLALRKVTERTNGARTERHAGEDEPVFRSRKKKNGLGGHLEVSQVNRIVARAAEDAGIERAVSPHWLRHAHASHAHARKTDLALIRDTLRHSSIATTGRYLHARPNDSSALHLGL